MGDLESPRPPRPSAAARSASAPALPEPATIDRPSSQQADRGRSQQPHRRHGGRARASVSRYASLKVLPDREPLRDQGRRAARRGRAAGGRSRPRSARPPMSIPPPPCSGTTGCCATPWTATRDARDALIAFAVKANSNLSVLKALAGELGCGADTVSEGEIRRALAAGHRAGRRSSSPASARPTPSWPSPSRPGCCEINVESDAELDRLIVVAAGLGARPDIAIPGEPRRRRRAATPRSPPAAPATSSARRSRRPWPSTPAPPPRTMCGRWAWPATSAARSPS